MPGTQGIFILENAEARAVPAARGRERGRARTLALGDVVAVVASQGLAYAFVNAFAGPPVAGGELLPLAFILVSIPVWLALFASYRLYEHDRERVSQSSFDEVAALFHALLVGSFLLLVADRIVLRFTGVRCLTTVEAALFLTFAITLIPIVRGTLRTFVLPEIMLHRRTMIVGTGRVALLVDRKLRAHPEYQLSVVGFCDDQPLNDIAVLGKREQLSELVERHRIDWLILADTSPAGNERAIALMAESGIDRSGVTVSIVPQYADLLTPNAVLDEIEGLPLVTLAQPNLSASSLVIKRGLDLLVGGLLALICLPVALLIALAIKLDSRGPVFYRQDRRGRENRTFSIFKFRSMRIDAEDDREALAHLNDFEGPLFKLRTDPRVTRVGAFLRRTSLDELPQLLNVLRGEMSLVGPRPFVVHEADQITGWGRRRLDLTPGITGLWQVVGRNDVPFEEMIKLDYLYVTGWSPWWDLRILFRTVPAVLRRKGAY